MFKAQLLEAPLTSKKKRGKGGVRVTTKGGHPGENPTGKKSSKGDRHKRKKKKGGEEND